jgi:hypothetical protein
MNRILFSLLFLFCLSFSEEEDPISSVKTKSENYFKQFKRTKLQLFFSQPYAAPGDTLRFGVQYLNANNLKPVAGRQLIHICLFDQTGKKQLTRYADVIDGYASREMVIPKELQPGNYKLVAFTDWMKNFDRWLFFQLELKIAGKFSIKPILPRDTLTFFPEGGSLVASLENNMAIRYTGKADQVHVILREGDKELAALNLVRDSVRLIQLKPRANTRYFAELRNDGETRQFELPLVKPSGMTLRLDVSGSRLKLNAELASNTELQRQNFYAAVFNNSGLIFQSNLAFDDENKNSFLLPASLPKGIAQVVIYNSKFDLLATRVIYIGQLDWREVSFANLQENYTTRHEMTLDFRVKDKDGNSESGNYSCRVVNEDLFDYGDTKEMDYLTFRSDISDSFGLTKENATRQVVADYLISQTCPWFVWANIIRENKEIQFKPQQYLTISGSASYAKNGKHVADSTLIMFFLEKSLLGYETRTDKKGNFSFPIVLTINHPDRFYFTASLKGKDIDDITLKMNDPDSALSFFASPSLMDKNSLDRYAYYSSQTQTINTSFSFFTNPLATDSIAEPNKAIEEELSGADLTVILSDYLMMPTMEDVVREIVKAVEYRKIGGRQVARVYTYGKVTGYSSGPLYVIDGVITKDQSYFFGLKPADVISIKVVRDIKKLFALGNLGANGVILVKTKLKSKIVKEKHVLEFDGLLPDSNNSFKGFANPSRPDLRPCLYWSSKAFSDNGGFLIFRTSDDIGKFKIQISGLTNEGTPFYSEHPFRVKYSGN